MDSKAQTFSEVSWSISRMDFFELWKIYPKKEQLEQLLRAVMKNTAFSCDSDEINRLIKKYQPYIILVSRSMEKIVAKHSSSEVCLHDEGKESTIVSDVGNAASTMVWEITNFKQQQIAQRPLTSVQSFAESDDKIYIPSDEDSTLSVDSKSDSELDESTADVTISSTTKWFEITGDHQQIFNFSDASGIISNISVDATPFDCFILFLSDNIVQHIVTERNRNAQQVLNKRQHTRSSRLSTWKPTNAYEMKKLSIFCYGWGLYKEIMKLDIGIAVDESIVPFRGRLKFRQHLPLNKHKYGIKLFKLCDTNDYVHSMMVYEGKTETGGKDLGTHVMLNLCEDYLDSGRILITDNESSKSIDQISIEYKYKIDRIALVRVDTMRDPGIIIQAFKMHGFVVHHLLGSYLRKLPHGNTNPNLDNGSSTPAAFVLPANQPATTKAGKPRQRMTRSNELSQHVMRCCYIASKLETESNLR
ncbi:hypothetical protein ILUMI_12414 [Ignelater luminosus]|uniref:PiggyBac transposable element-derived protein domain-containing protein n=1 Tax=Ignelater luminosus TaxID=2038154 RepID=A0A8K0GBT9_IGNLU|nr:hypothetical protein ILUMI_12414 [Ignelater luminosus]